MAVRVARPARPRPRCPAPPRRPRRAGRGPRRPRRRRGRAAAAPARCRHDPAPVRRPAPAVSSALVALARRHHVRRPAGHRRPGPSAVGSPTRPVRRATSPAPRRPDADGPPAATPRSPRSGARPAPRAAPRSRSPSPPSSPRPGVRTLLVDLDTWGASVAQVLGLVDEAPGRGRGGPRLRAGHPRRARAGPARARGRCPACGCSPACPGPTGGPSCAPRAVEDVLRLARGVADHVVVDTGFAVEDDEELSYDTAAPRRNAATLTALEAADHLVVVGAADPVGLQRLVRAVQDVAVLPSPRPTIVVTKVARLGRGSSTRARDRRRPAAGSPAWMPCASSRGRPTSATPPCSPAARSSRSPRGPTSPWPWPSSPRPSTRARPRVGSARRRTASRVGRRRVAEATRSGLGHTVHSDPAHRLTRWGRGRPAELPRHLVPAPRGRGDADARGVGDGLRRPDRRVRLREPRDPDQPAHRARAALPAADQDGARRPRQPGVGRRHALRHELPRAPQRPAAAGLRRAARGARRPHPAPPARPQPPDVGGLPRRGAGRGPLRDHHQDAPQPGRRHQRGRHRQRPRRRQPHGERGRAHHVAGPPRAQRRSSSSSSALTEAARTPEPGRRDHPARGRRRHPRRRQGGLRRRRRHLDPGPRLGPARPRVAAQRHGRPGPPLRHDRHRPRGLPQGPHPARPRLVRRRGDGQRRHPRDHRRCLPLVAAHPRRVRLPGHHDPRHGAGRPCTPATTRPTGAQVTACFVDLPVGEPGPSMRLHQIAFAMRQQMEGGSRRAVSADTLSGLAGFAPPTHARPRRPARRHGVAAPLQRRHHQRARPADAALRRPARGWSRPTRSPRSAAGRPSRSA